ncbi:uncharacterized protein VTP21DRAFT_5458 [Calcarisporiella thermophila]|uniref:uncharacterized protein n=1 Tax=Calcarisporiella thermophila TaxID=911321 RepID=UPI003744388F
MNCIRASHRLGQSYTYRAARSRPCFNPLQSPSWINYKQICVQQQYFATFKDNIATKSDLQPSKTQYYGPLGTVAKRLKIFSVCSLGASLALTPLIFIVGAEEITLAARCALAGAAISTSSLSTFLINWLLGPYVIKFQVDTLTAEQINAKTPIALETLTFLGRIHETKATLGDLEPSSGRPMTTWRLIESSKSQVTAKIGERTAAPKHYFFLHQELCRSSDILLATIDFVQKQSIVATSKKSDQIPTTNGKRREDILNISEKSEETRL